MLRLEQTVFTRKTNIRYHRYDSAAQHSTTDQYSTLQFDGIVQYSVAQDSTTWHSTAGQQRDGPHTEDDQRPILLITRVNHSIASHLISSHRIPHALSAAHGTVASSHLILYYLFSSLPISSRSVPIQQRKQLHNPAMCSTVQDISDITRRRSSAT